MNIDFTEIAAVNKGGKESVKAYRKDLESNQLSLFILPKGLNNLILNSN